MYVVLTNKYSHEGSSTELVLSWHHGLQDAKDAANAAARTRRWARVVDEQMGNELYRPVCNCPPGGMATLRTEWDCPIHGHRPQ